MKKIITVLLLISGAIFISSCVANSINNRQNPVAYLFAYFTGNNISEEAVCYAVSLDGFNYHALNGGLPILESSKISSTGGVRDPHILRGENGDSLYYMVLTDMVSANGWNSNRALILLKSDNLIDWTSKVINIQNKYEGQDSLKRVWAPQTIYDANADKYMVYWSMKYGNGPDIIYYAYANKDFDDFVSVPAPLFIPADSLSCIDGDIVKKDDLYYLFYKTEGHGNGIKVAITENLTSGVWHEYPDYKQQTTDAVEGAGVFKLIDSDKYILMYDVYTNGRYDFTESTDLQNFNKVATPVSMDFHPRHGSVIQITDSELQNLYVRYGKPDGIE